MLMLEIVSPRNCESPLARSATPLGKNPGVDVAALSLFTTGPSVVTPGSMPPDTCATRCLSRRSILVGAFTYENVATSPRWYIAPSFARIAMLRTCSMRLRYCAGNCTRTSTNPLPCERASRRRRRWRCEPRSRRCRGSRRAPRTSRDRSRRRAASPPISAPVCTLTVPGSDRTYAASLFAAASITSSGPDSV